MPQENSNETQATESQGQGKEGSKKKSSKKSGQKKAAAPKPRKEKPARETPAHMAKVEKVANQLPQLAGDAVAVFTMANNLSTADMCAIVAHLQVSVRRRGVMSAAQANAQGRTLKVGQRVRVTGGNNTKFIGQEGTVSKVQRIRCYVELDGRTYQTKKDGKGNTFKGDYFFTSEVEPASATASTISPETIARLTNPAPNVDINAILDEDDDDAEATGT